MTVNIVPPYGGWAEFRSFVSWAIDTLMASYPMAEKTLKPTRGHLRYIDAFDAKYGFDAFSEFVEEHLGAAQPIRTAVIEEIAVHPNQITFSFDSVFPAKSPIGANVRFRIAPGQTDGRKAAVMELHCDGRLKGDFMSKDELFSWYDDAHRTLSMAFDRTVSKELKSRFGAIKEIRQ